MASLRNALIGEYRILESLGAGGMGEVYKAVHTRLGRVIAIKVLSPGLVDDPAFQRFYSEASIQASLKHPGVAEYLGFHEYEGRPCILMEYVDGETLDALLRRRGPLPVAEAVAILRQVAEVAAHFHTQGVVHRDLKVSNVKLNSAGQVKILDFGIARGQRSDRLTRVGAVVGTPDALAPEQVRGEQATSATDVWQLGLVLYELLTARSPFHSGTTHETYARILAAEYPPLTQVLPTVPPGIARIVTRCFEKDPGRRFASGAELYQALCHWEQAPVPAPAVPRRALLYAGGAAAALLLVAGVVVAVRSWHHEESVTPQPPPVTPVPPTSADTREIVVDTADGKAEVYKDGKMVGATPYQVQARTGEKVNLVLRRDGFEDAPVEFNASEPHVYTYTLEPRKAP